MTKPKKLSKFTLVLISPLLLAVWILGYLTTWLSEKERKTILHQASIIHGSTCTYHLQQNEESMKCSKP
jgi:hypothetical protein